jgi:inorganic pyrophosphatase
MQNSNKEDVVNAIIEIPFRSRNKYEIDKTTGRMRLDRVLYSAMGYPAEYGYIEDTLSPDGDALDILVLSTESSYPGCVVPARVIGYLKMIDKGLLDYKIIAVTDCDPRYDQVHKLTDIADFTLAEIKNFFEEYKKLEGYEVVVEHYYGKEDALEIVEQCKKAYLENH